MTGPGTDDQNLGLCVGSARSGSGSPGCCAACRTAPPPGRRPALAEPPENDRKPGSEHGRSDWRTAFIWLLWQQISRSKKTGEEEIGFIQTENVPREPELRKGQRSERRKTPSSVRCRFWFWPSSRTEPGHFLQEERLLGSSRVLQINDQVPSGPVDFAPP